MCKWELYGETYNDHYYETECGQDMTLELKEDINPEYCPYCGEEIEFTND